LAHEKLLEPVKNLRNKREMKERTIILGDMHHLVGDLIVGLKERKKKGYKKATGTTNQHFTLNYLDQQHIQ
jgi:hypothetical protein